MNQKLLILYLMIAQHSVFTKRIWNVVSSFKTLDELDLQYEDEKNAMIAISDKDRTSIYEDFYEDMDNRIEVGQSMNMIFFGPASSFLRIDAETLLHLLQFTKKHLIPITRVILAWDMITDGKTAAFLQGREYLAFGTLLNVIPEEDLHYVNFGNPSVLKYFATFDIDLHPRKMGILVSSYLRYFGSQWNTKALYINELGYLLCGFSTFELSGISPDVFKHISAETFKRMKKCNREQLKAVYEIATSPYAYGVPYTWTAHEIEHLGELLNCIPKEDIGELQLEATSAINAEVIKAMDNKKLPYFSKQQILNMMPETRRVYILRMQLQTSYDMENIGSNSKKLMEFCYIINFVMMLPVLFLGLLSE